jgi:aerobic-type carbon monoxide dehydrogenase small subunit (CoxS/CutS family)
MILDGQAVCSCILYLFQKVLAEAGVLQCGFYVPDMGLSVKAMLGEQLRDDDIRECMDGNLCCCTGYEKIYGHFGRLLS